MRMWILRWLKAVPEEWYYRALEENLRLRDRMAAGLLDGTYVEREPGEDEA